MSSFSSSARRPAEKGRLVEVTVGTRLSLWALRISNQSLCLSACCICNCCICICWSARMPILAWCSSSARSCNSSSLCVALGWDDEAGEFLCLFVSFFTSNEGFLFELAGVLTLELVAGVLGHSCPSSHRFITSTKDAKSLLQMKLQCKWTRS